MSSIICEYCKKELKTKSYLKKHQSSAACIATRSKPVKILEPIPFDSPKTKEELDIYRYEWHVDEPHYENELEEANRVARIYAKDLQFAIKLGRKLMADIVQKYGRNINYETSYELILPFVLDLTKVEKTKSLVDNLSKWMNNPKELARYLTHKLLHNKYDIPLYIPMDRKGNFVYRDHEEEIVVDRGGRRLLRHLGEAGVENVEDVSFRTAFLIELADYMFFI